MPLYRAKCGDHTAYGVDRAALLTVMFSLRTNEPVELKQVAGDRNPDMIEVIPIQHVTLESPQ